MTEVEQQENEQPEAENVDEENAQPGEEAAADEEAAGDEEAVGDEDAAGDEAAEEAAAEDGYERNEEEEAPVVEEAEPEVEEVEEEVIEEPFVPGPLVISEAHEDFTLDKKMEDDPTVGLPNPRHIICQFCEVILIPDNNAVKISKEVNLVQNTQREYDLISTYWHCTSLLKFQNIEVHQMDDDMKYLCCLSCQSAILGYQIIESPTEIYIACDRVKLEIE